LPDLQPADPRTVDERAFARTTVRLDPAWAGSFGFACVTNMVHGTLVVDPSDEPPPPAPAHVEPGEPVPATVAPAVVEVEAARARERRAEITDLTLRVLMGAVRHAHP
jgi:Cu+-exporting ATPase